MKFDNGHWNAALRLQQRAKYLCVFFLSSNAVGGEGWGEEEREKNVQISRSTISFLIML
jgi:hypothetical protein